MKKIILASVLVIGLATGGLVYAHGGGYGHGGGYNMMGGGGYGMMSNDYSGMGGDYSGMGPGMMYGYGGDRFGQNGRQTNWNSENYQKFLNDTVQLRKEMNDKRFEYEEALRDPKTTRTQLATLEKAMVDLRYKLAEKADQYRQTPQVK